MSIRSRAAAASIAEQHRSPMRASGSYSGRARSAAAALPPIALPADAPEEMPVEEVAEPRQTPLPAPRFTLTWNPSIRIGPDRPASDPRDLMFRDDLAAIADHGSPGRLPFPDDLRRSPVGSGSLLTSEA